MKKYINRFKVKAYNYFNLCSRLPTRAVSSLSCIPSGKHLTSITKANHGPVALNPPAHPNLFLFSLRSKPLQIWDKQVRNGHIKRVTDPDIQSSVLEIMGTNVSTNYINAPLDPKKTLCIKLPFLVMIIKNLKKYFTFEV